MKRAAKSKKAREWMAWGVVEDRGGVAGEAGKQVVEMVYVSRTEARHAAKTFRGSVVRLRMVEVPRVRR